MQGYPPQMMMGMNMMGMNQITGSGDQGQQGTTKNNPNLNMLNYGLPNNMPNNSQP